MQMVVPGLIHAVDKEVEVLHLRILLLEIQKEKEKICRFAKSFGRNKTQKS